MSKVRRVDFSPDEYVSGVGGVLNFVEQGIYWLLCSLIMSGGGEIERNDRRIAALGLARPADVKKVTDRLIEMGKIEVTNGGKLSQKRARSEVELSAKRIQSAVENGSKGGRPSKKDEQNQQNDKAAGLFSEKLSLTTNHQPPIRDTDSQEFEEFWSAFPKRDGSNPRAPAEAAYRRARGGGASHAELLEGAKAYAAAQKREHGAARSRYTTMASTWLNQRRWESEAPKPNGHAPAHTFENFTEDEWVKWLDYCRPRGEWAKWLGPPPFTPGCKAPAHLLVDRDRKMTVQVAN